MTASSSTRRLEVGAYICPTSNPRGAIYAGSFAGGKTQCIVKRYRMDGIKKQKEFHEMTSHIAVRRRRRNLPCHRR